MAGAPHDKDRLQEVQKAFKLFDKNQDGKITKDELAMMLKDAKVNFTMEEIDQFFEKMDTDKSGFIDYDEFCSMMNMMWSACKSMEDGMKKIFKAIDKNSDEKISHEELRVALSNLGQDVSEEEAINIINTFDRDRDGFINFDEFITMMIFLNQMQM